MRVEDARRTVIVLAASVTIVASASACHGTPVVSSSHRPNNIFDVALFEGSVGTDEEVAERLLAERYPADSDVEVLISYLVGIGSECVSSDTSRRLCRISSFLEAKSAFWLFNMQLTEGETLALWEYMYTTTIESSGSRIKSIDVARATVRLK